jgi:hypothetical protein
MHGERGIANATLASRNKARAQNRPVPKGLHLKCAPAVLPRLPVHYHLRRQGLGDDGLATEKMGSIAKATAPEMCADGGNTGFNLMTTQPGIQSSSTRRGNSIFKTPD